MVKIREEVRKAFSRNLDMICDLQDLDPENPQIPNLKESIPSYKYTTADLANSLRVGFLPLNPKGPTFLRINQIETPQPLLTITY